MSPSADRSTLVVVPAKDPTRAKERLAEVLSPAERSELALALLDETLGVLATLASRPDLLVVTDAPAVERIARPYGAEILRDEAKGETAAVEAAAAWAVLRGYERQLVIPGDMAALDGPEVERILATKSAPPSVVLAPAVGEDGTNAILTAPPNAIAFRFGDRSFPDYQARAAACGAHLVVLRLPSLVLDIDTPDDLRSFLRESSGGRARDLLASWGVEDRLAPARARQVRA